MRPPPTGSTRVAAVIGDPVDHSLSPVIHNAAFGAIDKIAHNQQMCSLGGVKRLMIFERLHKRKKMHF